MIDDFTRALSQLFDRKFQHVLWGSILLTIALLFVSFGALVLLAGWAIPDIISIPWVGDVEWLSTGLNIGMILLVILLSVFLMFPVASIFIGFFLETIAGAVERKHYPDLPKVTSLTFMESLTNATKFMFLLIFANLVGLIIYFLSTVLAPIIFYLVNGFLLGREYFHVVGVRHIGTKKAKQVWGSNRIEIWMTGTLLAVLLSIPIVNLIVPILGVAVFTHQFHRLYKV